MNAGERFVRILDWIGLEHLGKTRWNWKTGQEPREIAEDLSIGPAKGLIE